MTTWNIRFNFFAWNYKSIKMWNWLKQLLLFLLRKKYCLGYRTQFVELFIKITPPNIDSDGRAKFFGKTFFLQSISWLKVIMVISSWFNKKSFSYLYHSSDVTIYLFFLNFRSLRKCGRLALIVSWIRKACYSHV